MPTCALSRPLVSATPKSLKSSLLVALNTLTNYVNNVAQTEIDFPAVDRRRAA